MNDALQSGKFEELSSPPEWSLAVDDGGDLPDVEPADDVVASFRRNVDHRWTWVKVWPLLLVIAGVCIGYAAHPFLQFQPAAANVSAAIPAQTSPNAPNKTAIMVDVKGDVRHPGVYQLTADARVKDAIQAAGGFLHAVDAGQVNLAAPVDDGTEVDVPAPSQHGANASSGTTQPAMAPSSTAGTAKLNVNLADAASLETIPGIGPAKAAAIITYRQQHGSFTKISDLVQVPGIGPATLTRIQPYLSIGS